MTTRNLPTTAFHIGVTGVVDSRHRLLWKDARMKSALHDRNWRDATFVLKRIADTADKWRFTTNNIISSCLIALTASYSAGPSLLQTFLRHSSPRFHYLLAPFNLYHRHVCFQYDVSVRLCPGRPLGLLSGWSHLSAVLVYRHTSVISPLVRWSMWEGKRTEDANIFFFFYNVNFIQFLPF